MPQESDARRAKRVRFEEPDTLCPLTSKPDIPSINSSRIRPPKCGEAKTSEYAFYKKLREDVARSSHSYQISEQHKRFEKPEACNHTQELTEMVKPNYETKSLSPVEKGIPVAFVSPISPRMSMNSGAKYEHEDIFSIKRRKLLHLAAEASSLDIDKLCSKGHDVVSMLLQRLHPESNKIAETSCPASRSSNTKFDSQLHVSLESDIHFEEVPQIPSMNLISPFAGKNLTNGLLGSWSNASREYNLSQEAGEDLGTLLTWHPSKIPECERRQPEDIVDCGGASRLHFEEVPQTPSMNLISPFVRKKFTNALLDYWPNKTGDYNLSQEVGKDMGTLMTWHSNQVLEHERRRPYNTVDCWEPSRFHVEKVRQTPIMNWISPYAGKNLNIGLLESWSNTSRECTLTQEIGEEVGSRVTWHPDEFLLECERRQPDDIVDCEHTPSSLLAKRDSAFGVHPNKEFSFSRDDYLALDYMPNQPRLLCPTSKSLSIEYGSPDKSLSLNSWSNFKESDDLGNKQWDQFLGWGTNTDLSNSSYGAASNWRSPSRDITLGNMSSRSYFRDTVGSQSLEYQVEEPDKFALPLCCTPKRCRSSSMVQETSIFRTFGNRFTPLDLDNLRARDTAFLVGGDTSDGYMESSIDSYHAYDSLEFLDEPSRSESREAFIDCSGDDTGQLLLMDSIF